MNARVLGLLALAVVGLAASLIWWNGDDSERGDETSVPASTRQGEPGPSGDLTGGAHGEADAQAPTGSEEVRVDSERVAIPETGGARVLRHDGSPAAGAEVSWVPVTSLLLYSRWDWDEVDADWFVAPHAFVGANGRVAPEAPDLSDDLGSVVWIDLLGEEPLPIMLQPTEASLEGREFTLSQSEDVQVTVLGSAGAPAQGVIVEQHGLELRPDVDVPAHSALLFQRQRTTDGQGSCGVTRFPGRQALVARSGGQVSRPIVIDEEVDHVELTLCDTFTVSGTVARPVAEEDIGVLIPRVTIQSKLGSYRRDLATAVVGDDDRFGPIIVPITSAVSFTAEVHGVGIVPNETAFATPAPGDHVTLHMNAEAGWTLWFRGHDQEGEVLHGTTAVVTWVSGERTRSARALARPDGFIEVLGIPKGYARATVSKPGYGAAVVAALEVPPNPPRAWDVFLTPAVPVSGRVVYSGEPVSDFEISWWSNYDPGSRTTQVFRDREDGTFHLDVTPADSVGFAASSPEHPGSEPLQVALDELKQGEVVIDLVGALRGEGRVIDAATSLPLVGSVVQPHVAGRRLPLTPWGPPLVTGADGSFQGSSFRSGNNQIVVSAPGYSTTIVSAESDGAVVSFGTISMRSVANVRVLIEGALEYPIVVDTVGTLPRATSTFALTEDGLIEAWMPDMPEGEYTIEVSYEDLTSHRNVVIGEGTNEIRFRRGTGSLIAEFGESPPQGTDIAITMLDQDGDWELHGVFADGRASVPARGLPIGKARVSRRLWGDPLVSRNVTILPDSEVAVSLEETETALLVRVVDGEGDPVTGATVRVRGEMDVLDHIGGSTDEAGEYKARSVELGRYRLRVSHPTHGLRPDIFVEIASEEGLEREVVLDGAATLELRVFDGDDPLDAIACALVDAEGTAISAPATTDADGRASIPNLTPGAYELRVTSDRTWTKTISIDVQAGMGSVPVEIWTLGDLRLRAIHESGSAAALVDFELNHESGETVHAWVESGRVSAEEIKTDVHGRLDLNALPRGSYRWSGGGSEGEFEVVAGEESIVWIAVP